MYKVYRVAASIIYALTFRGIPVSWIWRIVCECPDIFLTLYQLLNWINVLSNPCVTFLPLPG